jgi:hypothetical protein
MEVKRVTLYDLSASFDEVTFHCVHGRLVAKNLKLGYIFTAPTVIVRCLQYHETQKCKEVTDFNFFDIFDQKSFSQFTLKK